MRIDSHQHFWKYEAEKKDWIPNEERSLQKNFLPENIQPDLQQLHIEGCIAIQSINTEADTDFLLQLATKNDLIKGIVGWTDLEANNLEEKLVTYGRNPLMKGFRHISQADDTSIIISPSFKSGIELLSKNGFTYDILANTEQLRFAYQLAAQLPNQKFVIDHMGKPPIGWDKTADWKRNIRLFGPLQNVFCKVPGISPETVGGDISTEMIAPFLDTAVEVFGVNRLMYGSNWPVSLLKTDYATIWNLTENYFKSFSENEREQIFGKTATNFYGL